MADSSKPIDPSDQKRLQTRGKGIGKDYQPFIFIQELSSSGESVRVLGSVTGRTHHLLSGIELAAFTIFDWHRATLDIREQFPLPIEDTLNICNQLGIKHPQIRGNLRVVTTDFLIDLSNRKPLALAVKSVSSLSDVRTIEKLQIEKTYWENQGIEWRLFTDHEVSKQLKENLLWLRPMLNEGRPQKLSATPDHFGKVLPHVLSRTQRHRARHDPDRPVQWLQPAQACPADEPQPLDGQP
ncbi:TnsA endonuclease N-terminal domain-containing protein [Geopseudomonas aromaticivorans]